MLGAGHLPHIGHVDSEMSWRGGQQQLYYLADGLAQNGYPVTVFGKPGSEILHRLEKLNLHQVKVPMRSELDIFSAWQIANVCRTGGIRILHLHSAHAVSIGLLARLFYPKVKLVASRRVDFHIKSGISGKLKYKNARIDRIVCISERIRQVLLSDGIPENKLTMIHSGIDVDRYRNLPRPAGFKLQLGIPEHHCVIGTVAAMAWHKDYPTLLKAARIVMDKNDHVSFCAVGDGPDEKEIKAMAETLKLGDRFLFTGFRSDIANFFSLFDVFVLASRLEGLGTSILDAQSAGLPVVAADAGGIPEAVFHNDNGLLFQPENPEELANALLQVAEDAKLRLRLARRALTTVKAFDVNRTIEKNIKLYHQILNL